MDATSADARAANASSIATDPRVEPAAPTHTSVVFFHGMGKQRHYESVSMLVDMLEEYVHLLDPSQKCWVWKTKLRREKLVCDDPDAVCAAIQVDYGSRRVRFYEAYWAPAAVDGTTAASVFWWLMAQIKRPLAVLVAPWRSFSRLRRADLICLGRTQGCDEYRELCGLYGRFCEGAGHTDGSWRAFRSYVSRHAQSDADRQRLLKLADTWHASNRWSDVKRALLLATIGVTVFAAGALLVLGVLVGLGHLAQVIAVLPPELRAAVEPSVKPSIPNALALVMLFMGMVGASRFLKDSVGDVQQFVTYEEAEPLHERRQKILASAEATLRHVLSSPGCERVVIVAHSLGTAVALDTVLRLRGANLAGQTSAESAGESFDPVKLDLIHYFITSGSPIDKINYFFATLRSDNASFETLVDRLRGDLGDEPFSKTGRQPRIHWVNFWDVGDAIGGSLETMSAKIIRDQRVDNVRIASYVLPDPTASHAGYFRHTKYAGTIFESAFRDTLSFVDPPREPGTRKPRWPWVGPGAARIAQSVLFWTVSLVPVTVVWALAAALGIGSRPLAFGSMAAVVGFVIVLPMAVHTLRPRRGLATVQPALSPELAVASVSEDDGHPPVRP